MFSFSIGSWEVHNTILSTFYKIFHTLKKNNTANLTTLQTTLQNILVFPTA